MEWISAFCEYIRIVVTDELEEIKVVLLNDFSFVGDFFSLFLLFV